MPQVAYLKVVLPDGECPPQSIRGEHTYFVCQDVTAEVELATRSRAGSLTFPDTTEGERPLHGEISKHPELVSFLYDLNHLPECCSREKTASSLKVMQAIALGYFLAKGIVPGKENAVNAKA